MVPTLDKTITEMSAIDIADSLYIRNELGRDIPQEYAPDFDRYMRLRLTTPLQKKQIRKRKLNLSEAEALQDGSHNTVLIDYAQLEPLVPATGKVSRSVAPLVVQAISDTRYIVLDGNQRYWSGRRQDRVKCIVFPWHPHPVIQHYRLNRHPLSVAVTLLLQETGLLVDEIALQLRVSSSRIHEAYQAVNSIGLLAEELRKKHVTIYSLEKKTDSVSKSRGRPKTVAPLVPDDLLTELVNDPSIPDDAGLLSIMGRLNNIRKGKSLAVATLLAAYGKIPDIQPNHPAVRRWIMHLPVFLQQRSSPTL